MQLFLSYLVLAPDTRFFNAKQSRCSKLSVFFFEYRARLPRLAPTVRKIDHLHSFMSQQSPPEPPPLPRGSGKGSGQPSPSNGVNWRVLVLMGIATAILFMAWQSSGFGKPERLTYTQFRDYVDSGKIITNQALPNKSEGEFPDSRFKLKKSGESAAVPRITGFFYKKDPWIADKSEAPQEEFRIPVSTQFHDDEIKAILARHSIPLRVVAELPEIQGGELCTLADLRKMLARSEIVETDQRPARAFEIISADGSDNKYIVGTRYVFPAAPAATKDEDLAPFELDINYMELTDSELAFINDLAPFQPDSGMLRMFMIQIFPIFLIILIIFFLFRHQMKSAGRGAMSFGKSKAKLLTMDKNRVTFKDVAGIEEAKDELVEVVEYLRDPKKFQKLGGNLPKGLLMVGPPGTGKTLLARAIAGEADVPFFSISGSDFVEMFVGVGASRVRDMFEQGQKNSPCLIFIDEIDAVGRHRGHGMGGGHDEREQTLNQMLVEMDGFEGSEGIIVVAATNRPDVLDPALLRPGRFDRTVTVGLPDINGRDAILKVHMRKLPIAKNVKSMDIARGTPGFSGADLANLANEAALIAARFSKKLVGMREFEKAKDKIMMGAERKGMVMDASEKEMTAYHEAGHAIVGRLMPEHDPVYKVSIIPRGRALGVTMFLPEKDSYSISKRKLNSQVASLFGGRIAEEVVYGEDAVTTGASNDIERATEIAHKMVKLWGMSSVMGPMAYGEDEGEVFLGRQVTKHKHISDETFTKVDSEIRKIIDTNYSTAYKIIEDNRDILDAMAAALVEFETIDTSQIDDLMARVPMREPADVVDSEEVSSELGTGGKDSKSSKSSSDTKTDADGGTEQFA